MTFSWCDMPSTMINITMRQHGSYCMVSWCWWENSLSNYDNNIRPLSLFNIIKYHNHDVCRNHDAYHDTCNNNWTHCTVIMKCQYCDDQDDWYDVLMWHGTALLCFPHPSRWGNWGLLWFSSSLGPGTQEASNISGNAKTHVGYLIMMVQSVVGYMMCTTCSTTYEVYVMVLWCVWFYVAMVVKPMIGDGIWCY